MNTKECQDLYTLFSLFNYLQKEMPIYNIMTSLFLFSGIFITLFYYITLGVVFSIFLKEISINSWKLFVNTQKLQSLLPKLCTS